MNKKAEVVPTKPKNILQRPVRADLLPLFKSLSKGLVSYLTGRWDEVAKSAIEALASLGLRHEPTETAWLLIRRALVQAVFDLVGEYAGELSSSKPEKSEDISAELDSSLDLAKVRLSKRFFERPEDMDLLLAVSDGLVRWLQAYGWSDAQCGAVATRLPSYFVFALVNEWRKGRNKYEKMREAIETPFTDAAEREIEWECYLAWLVRQVDEAMLGEKFSLRQIYVPLNAYYEEQRADVEHEEEFDEENGERKNRVVVSLDAEFKRWIASTDSHDTIRVISGGPGAGKSSLCKMLAAHVAQSGGCRPLYVPLHQIDPSKDLMTAIDDFISESTCFTESPLGPVKTKQKLLLLFDGLDELSEQGKVGQDISREFVQRLVLFLTRKNTKNSRLKVMLTGRPIVLQAISSLFTIDRQVLHLLPYVNVSTKDRNFNYVDRGKLLRKDLRNEWWRKYGAITGASFDGIPKEIKKQKFLEITSQPLLNYLIAKTFFEGESNVHSVSSATNINQIYRFLLESVYRRSYSGGPLPSVQMIELEQFVRILEEIALTVWHGNHRTASLSEIEERIRTSGAEALLHPLRAYQASAEAGMISLLTAFYFRRYGRRSTGQETFEFTHKSFGEYLCAIRIIRGCRNINKELLRYQQSFGEEGVNLVLSLKHWLELTGPSRIDEYLAEFIRREIALAPEKEIRQWQKMLCELITTSLHTGMPTHLLAYRPHLAEECRLARNAELALVFIVSACSDRIKKLWAPMWPHHKFARDWIEGLWKSRLDSKQSHLPENIFSWMDLRNLDMSGSSVAHISLRQVDLSGTNLREANLRHAKLENSRLIGANLKESDLTGANLNKTDLTHADLQAASFCKTVLSGAKVKGANLAGIYGLRQVLGLDWSEGGNFDRLEKIMERPVKKLELSVRSSYCLRSSGIKTVRDLVRLTPVDLLKTKNFGRKSLNEINSILSELGLKLINDQSE